MVRQVRANLRQRLRRRRPRPGDKWHLHEVFLTIHGQRQYLWRAVDQDGKGTDLTVHRPEHLRSVEDEINRRPQMVLADRASADLFAALLASPDQPSLRR